MPKTPPLKKPKFGGPRKTSSKPPDKKVLEQYGPVPKKGSGVKETSTPGNREFGFIQSTPKKATGAMMGRDMPSTRGSHLATPRKDGKKQFKKAGGKKVF